MTAPPGTHPLDLAAMAAYGAYTISVADRLDMPPWEALPPEARADWRAVADGVLMFAGLLRQEGGTDG